MVLRFMLTSLGLPLVVAEFLDRRQQCLLDFCLLHLVLHVQVACHRVCVDLALLQLQLPRLRRVWPADGNCWVLGCIRLCAACLQVRSPLECVDLWMEH